MSQHASQEFKVEEKKSATNPFSEKVGIETLKAPNPFSKLKDIEKTATPNPFSNCSQSTITGGSSAPSPSVKCADSNPNPFSKVKITVAQPPAPNPFSQKKPAEQKPVANPAICDGSVTPCIRIPGWTGTESYNHSSSPVKVYLHDGSVVELPGVQNGRKWGLFMDHGGALMAKLWSEDQSTFLSGRGDGDGCAVYRGAGFPSPRCEEKRQNAAIEQIEREKARNKLTVQSCGRRGGKVVDPNDGAISAEQCAKQGGAALHGIEQADWPSSVVVCVKRKGQKKILRIADPAAPRQVCRFSERGRIEERPLNTDNPFEEILRHQQFKQQDTLSK